MGVYFVDVVHISTVNPPQFFGTNFSLVGSDNIFRNVVDIYYMLLLFDRNQLGDRCHWQSEDSMYRITYM
jgi:hypothetical protein